MAASCVETAHLGPESIPQLEARTRPAPADPRNELVGVILGSLCPDGAEPAPTVGSFGQYLKEEDSFARFTRILNDGDLPLLVHRKVVCRKVRGLK